MKPQTVAVVVLLALAIGFAGGWIKRGNSVKPLPPVVVSSDTANHITHPPADTTTVPTVIVAHPAQPHQAAVQAPTRPDTVQPIAKPTPIAYDSTVCLSTAKDYPSGARIRAEACLQVHRDPLGGIELFPQPGNIIYTPGPDTSWKITDSKVQFIAEKQHWQVPFVWGGVAGIVATAGAVYLAGMLVHK